MSYEQLDGRRLAVRWKLLIAHGSLLTHLLRGLRTGDRAPLRDDRGADFSSQAGFIEMGQEQTPQAAGRDFPGEIGVVDLIADAISPFPGRGFEVLVAAGSRLRRFFTSRPRQRRTAFGFRNRARWIEHA